MGEKLVICCRVLGSADKEVYGNGTVEEDVSLRGVEGASTGALMGCLLEISGYRSIRDERKKATTVAATNINETGGYHPTLSKSPSVRIRTGHRAHKPYLPHRFIEG